MFDIENGTARISSVTIEHAHAANVDVEHTRAIAICNPKDSASVVGRQKF